MRLCKNVIVFLFLSNYSLFRSVLSDLESFQFDFGRLARKTGFHDDFLTELKFYHSHD